MRSLPATVPGGSDPFTSTHWSVIAAASRNEVEPEQAHAALSQLCEVYWTPLYAFVRSRGHSVHDAQDLTQSFFAHLIEREIYGRADRAKGRFRSFLLAAFKNFLADAYAYAHALKRGGAENFLPLDESRAEAAESLFQTHSTSGQSVGEDCLFERSWADALVATTLEQLSAEYQSEGKQKLFERLKIFLTGSPDPLPSYDELSAEMEMPASSIRTYVTRLRLRYREMLRAQVRQTVETEAEVDAELHELFRVLSSA